MNHLWDKAPQTIMELTAGLQEETGWDKHTVITTHEHYILVQRYTRYTFVYLFIISFWYTYVNLLHLFLSLYFQAFVYRFSAELQ